MNFVANSAGTPLRSWFWRAGASGWPALVHRPLVCMQRPNFARDRVSPSGAGHHCQTSLRPSLRPSSGLQELSRWSNPEGCQTVAGGRSPRNDHRTRPITESTLEGCQNRSNPYKPSTLSSAQGATMARRRHGFWYPSRVRAILTRVCGAGHFMHEPVHYSGAASQSARGLAHSTPWRTSRRPRRSRSGWDCGNPLPLNP